MENNVLLAVLLDGENKIAEALRTTDVTEAAYGLLLETLAHVRGLAEAIAKRETSPYAGLTKVEGKAEEHPVENPFPAQTAAEEPKVPVKEDKTDETAKTVPVEADKTDAPKQTLTKADVRAHLAALANKGVDVAAVLTGMGYDRLSAVPEERYEELLAAANKEAG